jgi:hypothetical protein
VRWFQSIARRFHAANIATNECWRKAFHGQSSVLLRISLSDRRSAAEFPYRMLFLIGT